MLQKAICVRFGSTEYENFDEALSRLRQTGIVREYQAQFECLANQVQGWPKKALVVCFIGELKDEIAAEIKMFKPASISMAIGLAWMQEEKLQRINRTEQPPSQLLPLSQTGPTAHGLHRPFDDSLGLRCKHKERKAFVIVAMKSLGLATDAKINNYLFSR